MVLGIKQPEEEDARLMIKTLALMLYHNPFSQED